MSEHVVVLGKVEDQRLIKEMERLEPVLTEFARATDIAAECYNHGYASWQFIFRHPKGGAAAIQFSLSKPPDGDKVRATIRRQWWIDNGSQNIRRAADFAPLQIESLEPEAVRRMLEEQLQRLVHSDLEVLVQENWIPNYEKDVSSAYGKEISPTYGPFNFPKLPDLP